MRRILLIFGALCLVGAMIIIIVSSLSNAPTRIYRLTNGIQVELLGTAVGSSTFTSEKPWHKRARKIVPAAWQKWIPSATTGSCSSGTNSVTVYLRVTNTNGAPGTSQSWDHYTTTDNSGFVYQREGGSCTLGGGAFQMHGVILRTYPRRQPRFKLQLLDGKDAVLATLDIENPVRGPFPEWSPLPLPQTQTNGPVTLSLLGLEEGGDKSWRHVQPKWQLISNHPQWRNSHVRYATFVDPTGNEGQWLSPREKAWKVRANVARQELGDFSPSEYAAVTNVAIPGPGQNSQQSRTFDCNGVTLVFYAIAGPGEIVRTNQSNWQMVTNAQPYVGHSSSSDGRNTTERWGSRESFVLIEVQRAQPNDEFMFDLRDDQDRKIELNDSRGYNGASGGGRLYLRDFKPPKDAKSLNLAVIVNRPLEFEFMVNPADVKPAKK